MRRLAVLATMAVTLLAGCEMPPMQASVPPPGSPADAAGALAHGTDGTHLDAHTAARNFISVADTMTPAIDRECHARSVGINCDFRIVVDERLDMPPNAYQTLSATGQPIIAFTIGLIAEARNVNELAFIMGHEASHHILGHIPKQQQEALTGAMIFGGLASMAGADDQEVRQARDVGAQVGARRFSKEFELQADQLGTIIAYDAGYDPVIGAKFFSRIPDPGNAFLGSHPPNGDRVRIVQQTVAALQGQ